MSTGRRGAVVEQLPPTITIENTSAAPLTPNLATTGSLKIDFLPHPTASHYLSPSYSAAAHYSTAHPQSASGIPSDTTEWDPTMVSPARRDPTYNPTAASLVLPSNNAWGSSPGPQKQRQRSTTTDSNDVSSIVAEAPVLGVFPVLDPNLQLTQLHPIPLRLPRSRTIAGKQNTNASSTVPTRGLGQEPLGTDIPPTLPTMASSRPKRVTRSATSVQLTNIAPRVLPLAPIAPNTTLPVKGYQQQHTINTSRAQLTKRPLLPAIGKPKLKRRSTGAQGSRANMEASFMKEGLNEMATPNHRGTAPQSLQQVNPHGFSTSSTLKHDPPKSNKEQTGQCNQAFVGGSWAPMKHLEQQKTEVKTEQQWEQTSEGISTRYVTVPSTPARTKHLEYIPEVLPARVAPILPALDVLDPIPYQPQEIEDQYYHNLIAYNLAVDTTNPNIGTSRSDGEIPEAYDNPSWACSLRHGPLEQCQERFTLELEKLLISSSGSSETLKLGEVSGSTPTSYSQRPGSPNSLICMYRVHPDITANNRFNGMSLLHTKKAYIGESILLDLDMPEIGEVMEIDDMESLMSEMNGDESSNAFRLDSIEKDREFKGQCMKALRYSQLY